MSGIIDCNSSFKLDCNPLKKATEEDNAPTKKSLASRVWFKEDSEDSTKVFTEIFRIGKSKEDVQARKSIEILTNCRGNEKNSDDYKVEIFSKVAKAFSTFKNNPQYNNRIKQTLNDEALKKWIEIATQYDQINLSPNPSYREIKFSELKKIAEIYDYVKYNYPSLVKIRIEELHVERDELILPKSS